MRVLDLFSGIGGFSLGLERAGMTTVAFCEIDPFCRRVLAKHWPEVPIYDDVRTLSGDRLRADGIAVDVICGGFPCQDISAAGSAWGTNLGTNGERSGLYREAIRLASELRPRFVVMENVAALLGRGMGDVLRDLAEIGFDAEWRVIGANEVGADHRRERVWIVAYPVREPMEGNKQEAILAVSRLQRIVSGRGITPFPDRSAIPGAGLARRFNGVPDQVDRVKSTGNAVVPQIPEMIGRAIMAHAA
jgi:DNA (cytosine-5)-methyltransferase 1